MQWIVQALSRTALHFSFAVILMLIHTIVVLLQVMMDDIRELLCLLSLLWPHWMWWGWNMNDRERILCEKKLVQKKREVPNRLLLTLDADGWLLVTRHYHYRSNLAYDQLLSAYALMPFPNMNGIGNTSIFASSLLKNIPQLLETDLASS